MIGYATMKMLRKRSVPFSSQPALPYTWLSGHQAKELVPGKDTSGRRSRGRVWVTLVHSTHTNPSTVPNLRPIMISATTIRLRLALRLATPVHPSAPLLFRSALHSDLRKSSVGLSLPRRPLPRPIQQVKLPRNRKKSHQKSIRVKAKRLKHPHRSLRHPLLPCRLFYPHRKPSLPHPPYHLPLLQFFWLACLCHRQPYLACSHALRPSCLSDLSVFHSSANIPTVSQARSLLNG